MQSTTEIFSRSPIRNALGAIALALFVNAIVFAAGWSASEDGRAEASFAPPGWVIGSIWILLFACMGVARSYASSSHRAQRWVGALIVSCALYPFYTGGLQTEWIALAGTFVTLAIAGKAICETRAVSANAAWLIVPVVAWSCFAAAIIVENLRLA